MWRMIAVLVLLGGCAQSDPLAARADTLWILQSLDGEPFPQRAELRLTEDGRVTGRAPCNRFFGQRTGRYPDLSFGAVAATRMACPDLAAETAFLAALADVTTAELVDDRLILTGAGAGALVFTAAPAPADP